MSYTFSLSRRSLPVRCLCLLLAVLVLWCFFMVPRAGAVATEAATVAYAGALIGTILVGAGVVFSSHGDMQAVGAAMYKSWIKSSNAIGSTISAIASWALEHGEAVAKGALRVGKDMYQAVVDAFNAAYSGGEFDTSEIASTAYSSFVESHPTVTDFWFLGPPSDSWYDFDHPSGNIDCIYHMVFTLTDSSYKADLYGWRNGQEIYWCSGGSGGALGHITSFSLTCVDGYFGFKVLTDEGRKFGREKLCKFDCTKDFSLSRLGSGVAIPAPDLAYPSDNTLVRMPDIPSVDTATGDITYPNDAAYTKDAVSVPYPVDAEGVKVPDIPYDKVVDQSTGKVLDDADTGTDTKPGEGTGEGTETGSGVSGLIGTIIGLLKNFFDSPSDFKLDMDGFRNLAIADKFPFCIPFDMVDSVKQFAATAANYQFRIKFDTQYFSVDHTVDLTPIAVPLAFFRYIVCVWFVWVLMSRTHDLMKW